MTTAIDDWSKQRDASGENGQSGLEEELGGGLAPEHELEHEHEHQEFEAAAEHGELVSEDDAAHIAKKAKDRKIMMIAGGVVGALIVGVVGLKVVGGGAPPQQQFQQTQQVQQQGPTAMAQAPVELAPAVAAVPAAPVVAAPIEAAGPAPVPQPQGLQAPASGVANGPAPLSAGPVAPVNAAPAVPPAPMQVAAPALVAATQPVDAAESGKVAALRSDVDALRSDVEALRGQLASKDKALAELRKGAAAKPAQAHTVVAKAAPAEAIITERAPRERDATVAKAKAQVTAAIADQKPTAVVDPQVVAETKQTQALPPASAKGGKVRSEFSVYAISNGRAWVTWSKDGNNYTVGANSELPDYSKVTSIDDVKGVVFTSSGEIHPKPPTK